MGCSFCTESRQLVLTLFRAFSVDGTSLRKRLVQQQHQPRFFNQPLAGCQHTSIMMALWYPLASSSQPKKISGS